MIAEEDIIKYMKYKYLNKNCSAHTYNMNISAIKYFYSINYNKELLNGELARIEKDIKTLYQDFKQDLLDEDDYKKYYKEKADEKRRIKQELELLIQEEKNKPVIEEKEVNKLMKNILNMKKLNKDIISELIYDIQIDNDNQIYINYKYDIFNKVA